MQLLNIPLIKNPLNWAIIFMMLLIAAIAGHLLLTLSGNEPAS
jgi:hypothetical protein